MMSSRLTSARHACLALAAAALAAPVLADDHTDLEGSKIIGNRELPKVLYIVPWKKPIPGEMSPHPPKSVLDEALAPIDRDVFRRERSYDAQVQAATGVPVGAAPVAAPTSPAAAPAAPAAH
jgi:hypothetical protein